MMEGFYISRKRWGTLKKQIIFEKCHHWWGFQDDEKVKTLLAEQHLNLSDLQRDFVSIFREINFTKFLRQETQESPPSFIQFKKNSYKFLFVLACCSRIYNRYWIFIKLNDLAHKYTSFLAFAQLIYTHVFLNTNLLGYIGYCKRNKKRS